MYRSELSIPRKSTAALLPHLIYMEKDNRRWKIIHGKENKRVGSHCVETKKRGQAELAWV
jgi:hypothetical protein